MSLLSFCFPKTFSMFLGFSSNAFCLAYVRPTHGKLYHKPIFTQTQEGGNEWRELFPVLSQKIKFPEKIPDSLDSSIQNPRYFHKWMDTVAYHKRRCKITVITKISKIRTSEMNHSNLSDLPNLGDLRDLSNLLSALAKFPTSGKHGRRN